jgi:multiple sugar transport system ATP-binding protein
MIAGLESISRGTVKIGDKIVNHIPPKDRDIAMVFQSYALYPHMSVYDNMAFGLKIRKFPKTEIDRRVREAGAILNLTDYFNRKPKQLSGGQRQRVALGRAIVRDPQVFLMDEPLSNLDAKLRVHMRAEITKLHRRLKATTFYVTHDQVEAMTMGDRIAVLNQGVIQQVDTPLVIYNQPKNLFVAGFIGQMNFVQGVFSGNQFRISDQDALTLPDTLMKALTDPLRDYQDKPLILGIRPEHLEPATNPDAPLSIQILPELIETLGSEKVVHFTFKNDPAGSGARENQLPEIQSLQSQETQTWSAKIDPAVETILDTPLTLAFHPHHIRFFDPKTGERLPVAMAEHFVPGG